MTAEPNPRPLSLVAQTPDNAEAETLLRQWDPEAQLVGALMHLRNPQAAAILQLVPDDAIWRPDNRWVYEVIRDVVAGGDDPDPVVVLHTARNRPPADVPQPGRPVSAERHHQFAIHLADLYTRAVTPAAARQYARDVVEDAYRRAVGLYGARLVELAECGTSRSELTDYLAEMRATLAELWRRAEAAAITH